MVLFNSDWQRLHKKIIRQYELMAIRNFEKGLSPEGTDVLGIITEIFRKNVPYLRESEVEEFVRNEQESFKNFAVRDNISNALRQMKPGITETEVSEIFEAIRNRFLNSEKEHRCFLFFIISKIIELKNLSISRGAYLIEIALGRIPEPSRWVRFFQMWRLLFRYKVASDRITRTLADGEESVKGQPFLANYLGKRLIEPPQPGSRTNYKQAKILEATIPNTSNAWTHLVPTLAKYAKCEGKGYHLGRDNGERAKRELEGQLYLVVLALYGDGLLLQGSNKEECLLALLRSLVSFKDVYPNWTDAYYAAYKVFVQGRENITAVIASHQRAVEDELFNRG